MTPAATPTASRIETRLRIHGLDVPAGEVAFLARYYELLRKWNARINLTSLADGDDAIDRLIVEPAMAAGLMPLQAQHLDIGSGGGSPAFPVRVLRPQFRSVLVESRTRKAAFLREAARVIPVEAVTVASCRLEDLPRPRELFSLVTVRAVRIDDPLLATVEGLVAGGAVVWYLTGPGTIPRIERPGWTLQAERGLLPEKQSRVLCFTWNNA